MVGLPHRLRSIRTEAVHQLPQRGIGKRGLPLLPHGIEDGGHSRPTNRAGQREGSALPHYADMRELLATLLDLRGERRLGGSDFVLAVGTGTDVAVDAQIALIG